MAGEDYSVKTKVTADVSNFEKGMNKAEKSLKGFSDKLANSIDRLGKKGLIGSIANVTLAMQGLTKSFGTVIKFAKDVGKAINECTEAYKGQVIAERALDTAIQNNPFISGESSKALKQFANDMQRVSNYGDEELIPMMTNLVSLGRTEAETMQIMSVAMDMSAGMGISLDTAITQLNATLNGNIGRLGQQNAELKGLTEEELKQGKAIEILGEKFKGLSSATADTSKQLQNIKGDFKEALGQFTLPSSEMWNKFWLGFYERGIQVIQKLDDYLDVNTVGKKIFENIQDEARKVAKSKKLKISDVLSDFNFISENLSALSDKELSTLKKSLEGIEERTDIEQYWLNMVSKRLHNKELEAEQERKNAELEAKRAREQADREAKEKALAEEKAKREKELAELRERMAKLQEEWQDKLFTQRIEQLERARDRELENEELTEEQKNGIREFYMQQIVTMKVAQLEKERDEILKNEELTEEARLAVQNYYSNKIQNVKEDEAKKIKEINDEVLDQKKKNNKEEEKDEKSKLAKMVEYAKQYAQKIKSVISKVVNTIKSVVSGGISLFQKLFEIDPDEILNNVLKIEDKILTFFVDTLPKMPSLISSIMESISVLLGNILKTGSIKDVIVSILKIFTQNLPQIISDTLVILEQLIDGVIDGLIEWIDSDDGINKLLKLVLQIQKAVEKVVSKALTKLVDMFDKHKDDFSKFLADSLASANRTLPVLLNAILKLIGVLIEAIANAFADENFVNSIIESIEKSIDALIQNLPRIITAIIKLITNIIIALVPYLPDLILKIITEIVSALPQIMGQIVSALSKSFVELFKRIFSKDFFIETMQNLGGALGEIIKSAFTFGFGGSSGGGGGFDPLDIIDPIGIRHWFADGTNNAPAGLSVVGEAGPELVKFRGGEQVLNAHNTNKALENMGGNTNNFNVTFNNLQDTSAFAMMNQLKQYNRQMAINGVI